MEKQSRWSEQRSEQRVQQSSERREQVVQQQERVQRTEQHYTRQMLTQQGTSRRRHLTHSDTHHGYPLFLYNPHYIMSKALYLALI